MSLEQPDMAADVNAPIYLGSRIDDYVTALEKLGYQKEQVTKILVTHKHPDHTGELRSFPKAKIYISRIEADAMELKGDNVVRVDFTDGAYPEHGIPAGTAFEDLPADWKCPVCRQGKDKFNKA